MYANGSKLRREMSKISRKFIVHGSHFTVGGGVDNTHQVLR